MPARVFVAIELPPATRLLMTEAMRSFLSIEPSWRTEKPVAHGLLHVTLAFLGAVPDPLLEPLLERLGVAVKDMEPFEVRVAGARAVPSMRHASMLWATLDDASGLAASLSAIIAREAGLPAEGRAFRAHVTLARSRRPRAVGPRAIEAASTLLSDSGRLADRTVSVRSATVFSSTLRSAGPAYEPLALLAFGAIGGNAAAR